MSETTAVKGAAGDQAVFTTVDSPIGKLLLLWADAAVVRVAFENENHESVIAEAEKQFGHKFTEVSAQSDDHKISNVATQLTEYFAGQRQAFDVPVAKVSAPGVAGQVQQALSNIEYGKTASYGELAETVGHPGAARAVGTACATNPIPILRPCHRVVRSDGSIGEYLGGSEAKVFLLNLEKQHVLG